MEKIDAASMKELTIKMTLDRENSISRIISDIQDSAFRGNYSTIAGGLTDSQKKQLKDLGYKVEHDAGVGWLISWG